MNIDFYPDDSLMKEERANIGSTDSTDCDSAARTQTHFAEIAR